MNIPSYKWWISFIGLALPGRVKEDNMPETRYVEIYDNQGNVINTEPYEVSDAELGMERAEKAVAELSDLADTELTTSKLKKLVKALARLRR
jgi:5-methylthioribose kinase